MTTAPRAAAPWWSPRRVAWAGGLLIAAMAAQAAYDIWRGYHDAVKTTERDLDTQARVIAEQSARGVQAIDVVLKHLAQQLGQGALAEVDSDTLHAFLKEQAVGLVQSDGLVVFHADGTVRAVSQLPIARVPPLNMANDPPFATLRQSASSALQIDPTRVSPGTRRWVFPIGRRVTDREGRFVGVVGAPGRVEYFQQFYRDSYPQSGTRISLLHRDGWLLARHPPIEAALGRRFPIDPLLPPAGSEQTAFSRRPSPVDGVDHFVALRLVSDYPLVVAVSRDAAIALAPWRAQALATALRTLALAALASGMLWAALRHLVAAQAARRSLEISQERYALAAAGSDMGVWDWDLVAGTAYESRRARELQGLPLEPETQPLDELRALLACHPDDSSHRALALQAHLDGASPYYEVEYRVRRPEGTYAWIHVRALCVRDATGRPLRIAGSVSDIDARKRAEVALRESEQRFAVAVAGSDDGIWEWDFVRQQAFGSHRGRELLGLPPGPEVQPLATWRAEIAGQIHPDDLAGRDAAIADHLAGRTPAYVSDFRVRHADGRWRWVHIHGRCERDADGQPLRMAGSGSDIDARKRAEEALRQSEERYALAMTGWRGGHCVWDTVSDELFVSENFNELFGFAPDTVHGTRARFNAAAPIDLDDQARVQALGEDLMAGRIQRAEYEHRIALPEGERWVQMRAQRFSEADGRGVRIAGVAVDITEQKQAEFERQRLEQQLRQAQKLEAIGTLAGGIAHDFNNILSAILGYGDLAQKNAPEGTPLRRHIDAAIAAGQRAKSLVERILAFSRSGMGERVPVHAQSVVDEALDAVAAALPAGVQLVRRLRAGDGGVLGDPTQIHQVVMNLCANAVQAVKAEGRIDVSLDALALNVQRAVATSTLPAGSYLRLSVADTGSGMAPELIERIFDPFFTTKEVGVGTGLGLSLVHGIVTDLGGGIEVQSRLGEGSRFTVWLPSLGAVAPPAPDRELAVERGQGQVVMLVDDEEALVRLGEETLAELGYEPIGFTSAREALAALRAEPARFDLLLTDETMPELVGTRLAREARALRPGLPVVLMSGYVTPSLQQRAREAGASEVLAKPLAAAELAHALAAGLRRAAA